jgi:hypothetical protein
MPTAPKLDSLKPGQSIRCTITKAPRTEAKLDTLERLMQMDPGVKRGLRRAQRRRRQDMVVYNRGNRDWYKREKCAQIARPQAGSSWTMVYSHQIQPDLASVSDNIKVEQA